MSRWSQTVLSRFAMEFLSSVSTHTHTHTHHTQHPTSNFTCRGVLMTDFVLLLAVQPFSFKFSFKSTNPHIYHSQGNNCSSSWAIEQVWTSYSPTSASVTTWMWSSLHYIRLCHYLILYPLCEAKPSHTRSKAVPYHTVHDNTGIHFYMIKKCHIAILKI